MKRLLVSIALACASAQACATAYTSNATGNWNSTSTWSPSGIPGSGDTVTLANSYTVTIPTGYTATVGTSPASGGAAAIMCSSSSGTGILIVNGTLDLQGPVNQCPATWQVNPQTAAATTTGTWSSGSNSVTLASGTGVAIGQAVTGAGMYPGTIVLAISGTSLTLSLNAFAAGSVTTLTFFSPSLIHDSSLASAPATSNYVWQVGYTNGGNSGPYAVLKLNGTSSGPVTVENAVGSGNFGGFSNSTYQESGMMQATYANFIGCGTASGQCWYPYFFYYGNGLSASCTHCAFVSSGVIETDVTTSGAGSGLSFIFNNNTIINPINSSGYAVNLTIANPLANFACQIENNYIEGEFKEAQGNGSDDGQDDQCIVNGNVFAGSSSYSAFAEGTVGHATGHFDGDLFYLLAQASTGAYPAISVTRAVTLLAFNNSSGSLHLYCGDPSPYAGTVFNGGTVENQYNSASGDQGSNTCLYFPGGSFAYTIEGWLSIPTPNGYSPTQIVNGVGSPPSGETIQATHNTVLASPTGSGGFGAFAWENSTGEAALYAEVADNIFWLTPSTSGTAYGVGWYTGYTPGANTFENVGNNAWWEVTGSAYTSKYVGPSTAYSPTPPGGYGSGDVAANPQYVVDPEKESNYI